MIANVHQYWVYMMSNKTRSILYIGITNDLYRRYNVNTRQAQLKGLHKITNAIILYLCGLPRTYTALASKCAKVNFAHLARLFVYLMKFD